MTRKKNILLDLRKYHPTKIIGLFLFIGFVWSLSNLGVFSTELKPTYFVESGSMEVIVGADPSINLYNVIRGWERSDTQIGAEWTSFTKDLGGDLSKYYSSNCYKMVDAYNSGCSVKTEFVARKDGWSSGGQMTTTQITQLSGSDGWKAQALKYITVSGSGEYTVSATTCAVNCPGSDPTNGACFYKAVTVNIAGEPDCDVGTECKKHYVRTTCEGNKIYTVYEIFKYNSNCECVYNSDSSEYYKTCDYDCENGVCVGSPPSCDIGTECKREDVGSVCRDGNVNKETKIYIYDSNCDCNVDRSVYSVIETCSYGCENGLCKPQDAPTKCYSDADCLWCGGNCLLYYEGLDCPIIPPPENYDCVCDLTSNSCYAKIKEEPTCKNLWWFDNENQYCDLKEFCGSFYYNGLEVFDTRAQCENALGGGEEISEIPWLYIVLAIVLTVFAVVLYWFWKK